MSPQHDKTTQYGTLPAHARAASSDDPPARQQEGAHRDEDEEEGLISAVPAPAAAEGTNWCKICCMCWGGCCLLSLLVIGWLYFSIFVLQARHTKAVMDKIAPVYDAVTLPTVATGKLVCVAWSPGYVGRDWGDSKY